MIGIEIVTIGREILTGRTTDTNFAFLARGLRARGLPCSWRTSVPDEREMMLQALEIALQRAEVVITTGGLGGTSDDITRKILATVLKRQLILREDLLATMRERFSRVGRPAPANLEAQALIPFGAELIPNEVGLAPGLRLRAGERRVLYALPGVPAEMEAMAERAVLPEIASMAPAALFVERSLRTCGIPETVLAEKIEPLLPPGVRVAYLPHAGTVELRVSAEGDPAEVEPYLDRLTAVAKERIGPAVYCEGEITLEEAVGRSLLARSWRLAVAESLTGGGVGARLVRVPGASRYFLGDVVAYDNAAKVRLLGVPESTLAEHGAVSARAAEAMAAGVRERLGAEIGVSTTGIAGPEGGSAGKPVGLVYFGLSWEGAQTSLRRMMPGSRELVIERSILTALDLVRRVASGVAIE